MAETISFARGVPAQELLPAAELAECASVALADPVALAYGPPSGFEPLRAWIAARHGVSEHRVVVTNGSLQGFVLLARELLRASTSNRVLVEAPTYDRPLRILAELGADVVPVPVDDEGMDVAAVRAEVRRGDAAFVYTIPTFQNPTGRTLTVERRSALVAVAGEHDVVVLEDDPYGLVRFEGEAPPTLLDLGQGAPVVYSSSFSKTVAPGLRVGYLVLPDALARAVEAAAVSTYIAPAAAGQATLWEFVRRGLFERNLERVRSLLRARRDAMVVGLRSRVGAAGRFTSPEGGYFVWLELAEGVDEAAFVARTGDAGVSLVPGADFFVRGRSAPASVRLAFSAVSPEEIEVGVERLAAALPSFAAV